MGRYILCIDNGLTTTKSVIFSLDGTEIATSLCNTIIESKSYCSEIDMELQWSKTAEVVREVIKKAGIEPTEIIGIGNSGHGAGLYLIDNAGKPIRRAISSMDSRTVELIRKWTEEGKTTYDKLYQNLWSGQAIPLLHWIKTHEPQNYSNIHSIFMVKDWIIYNLTGNIGIEYTDASNSGLINPRDKSVDRDLLEIFGVEDIYPKIPSIRKTTEIAGYVTKKAAIETGLPEGTPVMGGIFDCIACALGSGVFSEDKYSLIAGTWNVNSAIEEKLVSGRYETIKCSLFADINKYFYVESSATSAVNLEWFIENIIKGFGTLKLTNGELYKLIDKETEGLNISDSNILYMPFLYKSHLCENLEGTFLGIKPEHNVFNMLLAVFEGVVFAHLRHIENLKQGQIVRRQAVLSGGASNSTFWSQMFADILNMEIVTTNANQAGALGTAICTAIALGIYKDFNEAINSMVKERKRYYPNKEKNQIYMRKYEEFNRIINLFDNK